MTEHNVTVENTLQVLLKDKKYTTVRDILVTMNPADIAAVFSGCKPEQLPLLFRLLPKELAAESFVDMESDEQETLIRGISDSELKQVMDELYVDDAVDIVEEMPANVVQRILAQSDPQMRKEINEILLHRLKNNIRFCAQCSKALPLHHHGRLCDDCYRRLRKNSGGPPHRGRA